MAAWVNDAEFLAVQDNYERARREIDVARRLAAAAQPVAAQMKADANPNAKTPVPNDVLAVLANALDEYLNTSPTL